MTSIHAVSALSVSEVATPDQTPHWSSLGCQRARKPDGGFWKRSLQAYLLPWLAFQHKLLGVDDLRVYLGAHEMLERRCQKDADTPALYTCAELQDLLQAPRRAPLERSVARLDALGLLHWTPEALHVVPHPERLQALDPAGYRAFRTAMPTGVAWMPVPRRLGVWLAQEGQPGLIATVLGVLVRCMRYWQRQCVPWGRVAPGWIARVFGVSERTVQRNLQTLEACGWLARRPEGPAQERLHGRFTLLNLHWARPGMTVRPPREPGQREQPARQAATPKPAKQGGEPKRQDLAAGRQESCRNLSPLPAPSGSGNSGKHTHYDAPQPLSTPLQPFQEIFKPVTATGRPTGSRIERNREEETPFIPHQPVAPLEDVDETTVTEAEYTVATASLVAQGHKPAFLIRPAVLAEVQRLRQVAPVSPSPLTTPDDPKVARAVDAPTPPAQEGDLSPETTRLPAPLVGRPPCQPAPSAAPFAHEALGLARVAPAQPLPAQASVMAVRQALAASPHDEPAPMAPAPRPAWQRPPSLADVTLADLRDVERLLELHPQAMARGWLRESEADRLTLVAAAAHALQEGDDPCKLFAWLLRSQDWKVITQEDEGRARQLLRAHDWGPGHQPSPGAQAPPAAPALSADARCVQRAAQMVQQAGWRGEAFLAAKMADASWTRQRWDTVQAELAAWRQWHTQQQRGRRALEARGEDLTRGEEDADA